MANINAGGGRSFGSSKEAVATFDAIRAQFLHLHARHIDAIKSGRTILAHDIVGSIHDLIYSMRIKSFWANEPNSGPSVIVNYLLAFPPAYTYVSTYPGLSLPFLAPSSETRKGLSLSIGETGEVGGFPTSVEGQFRQDATSDIGPEYADFFDAMRQPRMQLDLLSGDKDETIRWAAARASAQAGPEAAFTIPALLAALNDQSYMVSFAAADTLRHFGASAHARSAPEVRGQQVG